MKFFIPFSPWILPNQLAWIRRDFVCNRKRKKSSEKINKKLPSTVKFDKGDKNFKIRNFKNNFQHHYLCWMVRDKFPSGKLCLPPKWIIF